MASQELNQALWNAANVMRSTMSADEYKDYLLGLVFYKYLSDRQLYAVVDLLEDRQPESLDEAVNLTCMREHCYIKSATIRTARYVLKHTRNRRSNLLGISHVIGRVKSGLLTD